MRRIDIEANQAMQQLYDVSNTLLSEVTPIPRGNSQILQTETNSGLQVLKLDERLLVAAEFDKPRGASEIYRVEFPEDIGNIALTRFYIDWYYEGRQGTNTVARRNFPRLAGQLLELV